MNFLEKKEFEETIFELNNFISNFKIKSELTQNYIQFYYDEKTSHLMFSSFISSKNNLEIKNFVNLFKLNFEKKLNIEITTYMKNYVQKIKNESENNILNHPDMKKIKDKLENLNHFDLNFNNQIIENCFNYFPLLLKERNQRILPHFRFNNDKLTKDEDYNVLCLVEEHIYKKSKLKNLNLNKIIVENLKYIIEYQENLNLGQNIDFDDILKLENVDYENIANINNEILNINIKENLEKKREIEEQIKENKNDFKQH